MKKWMKITLWSLFGCGLIALHVFINNTIAEKRVIPPEIEIKSEANNTFITEDELLYFLKAKGVIFDLQKRSELEIESIEDALLKISQVKTVDVYQYVTGEWKITLELRKPIARIYNTRGDNFYLDEDGVTVSSEASHVARVLIVTGDINDLESSVSVPDIINNDSLISIRRLDDIYRISHYVCNDPLLHSLIGQIHLKKNGDFILVPLVGDQKIIVGSAYSNREVKSKFEKLKIFYNEAMPFEGWDKYSEINLKFEGQIVCKKK